MKTLFVALLSLFVMSCHSQSSKRELIVYQNPVCDETEVKPSGEKAFKVVSSNDSVVKKLLKFEAIPKKYAANIKSDRHGSYWEYTITYSNEWTKEVITFLQSLK